MADIHADHVTDRKPLEGTHDFSFLSTDHAAFSTTECGAIPATNSNADVTPFLDTEWGAVA